MRSHQLNKSIHLAARASKMGNMEMEKRRAMSMAVSKRPVCTSKATTSSALTNGPAGHAQY